MNCPPRCNHPFETGQKFCSTCGNPLPVQAELKCPKCHSSIEQDQKFCTVCGNDLQHSVSTSTTYSGNKTEYHDAVMNKGIELRCPECGKITNSLKQATLFNKLLFLMIYTQWQTVTYTCCPECMRKHIANRSAATLITGNFMWLLLALPLHGYHLHKSYQPGHSKAVMKTIQ